MSTVPMTKQGQEGLQEELNKLKFEERPKVIAAIAEARGHGDLKENAEYHAAKEHQGFIEARIADIESKLSHAKVIDVTTLPQDGRVVFGVTVELINCEDEAQSTYQIVGDDEADLKHGKISINAPMARALIGKKEGDVVTVQAPSGNVEYEIDKVRYL